MPLLAKSQIMVLGNCECCEWSKSNWFAPVLWFESLCYLVSLGVQRHHCLKQGDSKNAFYQGILPPGEVMIVRPPLGDPAAAKDKYWLLLKTLYWLRRSPCHWYKNIDSMLHSFGQTTNTHDPADTPCLCGTLVFLLHPIRLFFFFWVSTLTTVSISWRILMLRCCLNIFFGNGCKLTLWV